MNIAIIIPYYGRWPEFFTYFLWSVRFSPELHYHFITDLEKPDQAPDNCFFHSMSYTELQMRFSERLNIPELSFEPYKLCDFKPTYGHVFSDLIGGYAWWGFGDIDLALGSVNNFITKEILLENDFVSFREGWVSGSLAFFRNIDRVNLLYRQIENLEELLLFPEVLGIDEVSGLHSALRVKSWKEVDWPYDNLTRVIRQASDENRIKSFFKTQIKESIHVDSWVSINKNGCFDQLEKEYAYYHFITEKKRYYADFSLPIDGDELCFSHSGAVKKEDLNSLEKVHWKRKIKFYPRYIEHLIKRVKNKLKAL